MRNFWQSLDGGPAQTIPCMRMCKALLMLPKLRAVSAGASSSSSLPAPTVFHSSVREDSRMASRSPDKENLSGAPDAEASARTSPAGTSSNLTGSAPLRLRQRGDEPSRSNEPSEQGMSTSGRPDQHQRWRGGASSPRSSAAQPAANGSLMRKPQRRHSFEAADATLRQAGNGVPAPSRAAGPQRRAKWAEDDSSGASSGAESPSRERAKQPRLSEAEFRAAVHLNSRITRTASAQEVLDIVDKSGHQFNAVNAATAFHRLAKFGQEMAPAQQAGLREDPATVRLARIVEECWAEWGGRAANNIGWAQAVLGHGSPTLMAKVEAKFFDLAPSMDTMELSVILWSFAKSGHAPAAVFSAAVPFILARKQTLDKQSISMIAWAYATAGQRSEQVFAACCETALARFESVDLRALSNLVWACARVDHYDEALFDAAAGRVAHTWRQLCTLDLGNYAWAIGKAFGELATRDSDVTEEDRETTIIRYITSGHPARLPALRALSAACKQQVGSLTARVVANVTYGFSAAFFYDQELMDMLGNRIVHIANTCGTQPLGIVPWAFAQLRHDHPPMFEAMARRGLQLLPLPEQAGGINDRSMAMCIWAYANLGVTCPTTKAFLLAMAEEACARESYKSVTQAGWALTVIQALPEDMLRRIRAQVGDVQDMDTKQLSQLYQIELAVRLQQDSTSRTPGQASAGPVRAEELFRDLYQMGAVRASTKKFWDHQLAHGQRHVTNIHLEVADTVRELNGVAVMEFDTGEWSVDIGFRGHKVAIEVDGPCHFTANTLRPLGPTLLKRRLIAASGWRVAVVPYYAWNQLCLGYERQLFIHLALQEASREVQLVSAPSPPPGWGEERLANARRRVHELLAHQQEADSRDAAVRLPGSAEPLAAESRREGDELQEPLTARAESGGSAAAAERNGAAAAAEGVSGVNGQDTGGAAGGQQARRLIKGGASRAALLDYKQGGEVSRHKLLLKVAAARALEKDRE